MAQVPVAEGIFTFPSDAPQLSQNEIAMIKAQLTSCWNVPAGITDAKDLTVEVQFSLNRDGSLSGDPIVLNHGKHALFQIAAESAVTAVRRCSPFQRLPVSKYEVWRELLIDFDPKEMFGRM